MPIQVLPQAITLYPGDEQVFTLDARQPPTPWATFDNFKLQSDYSMKLNTGITSAAIRGGLQLRSGSGSVEFTLDAQWLPGSTFSIGFAIGVNATGTSFTSFLEVRFSSTQYKMVNGSGDIAGTTTSFTAAVGTRIKLEMFGDTLRVYLDDVLKYTQKHDSINNYPGRYLAYVHDTLTSHASGNKLPAPVLTGDWGTTENYLDWDLTAGLGGRTLDTPKYNATVTVAANCKPGQYDVTGAIGAYGTFTAAATTDTLTLTADPVFAVNDLVRVGVLTGGTLPTPLTSAETYYVKTYTTSPSHTMTLSRTQGGATLDITADGTGWIMRNDDYLLQRGQSLVTVPPFDVIGIPGGAVKLTVQPSEVIKWQTTYDKAQKLTQTGTAYITRSISSSDGGSFNAAGVFTAGTVAGDYTVTFEQTGTLQRRVWTITIPKVMTPDIDVVAPSEQIVWTSTLSPHNWTASAGTPTSGTGSTFTWTAPSVLGQVVRIQDSDGGSNVLYKEVTVLDTLPVSYTVISENEVGPDVLIEYAEDGRTPWVRSKTETGFTPRAMTIECNGLTEAQWESLVDFHDEYLRSAGRFFITDYLLSSERLTVRFDSKLSAPRTTNDCLINTSFRVRLA